MTHRTPLLAALPLLAVLATPLAAQETPVTADTVVATVDGAEITVGHMLVVRARLPQEYQQLEPQVLFDGILDQLIQQTVLGQTAGDLNTANRLILENEERALLSSQTIAATARDATTDEAIQAAYDDSFGTASGETEYNAAHILVETEEEAAAIVAELEGGADFATLAQERSVGPSGPNGGDLGWFGAGMMVPQFEEAVIALEPGAVSDPVQTQFGWHVILLKETRQPEAPTLDEVRDQLVEQVQRAAVDAQVAALEAEADITRPDADAFDPTIINDFTLISE
jgi:peptidyl-prolyl cis-trans isomerase C